MNTSKYMGYTGSIERTSDLKYAGKLLYIDDLIMYESDSFAEIFNAFKTSVDDYLKTCNEINKVPQVPKQ